MINLVGSGLSWERSDSRHQGNHHWEAGLLLYERIKDKNYSPCQKSWSRAPFDWCGLGLGRKLLLLNIFVSSFCVAEAGKRRTFSLIVVNSMQTRGKEKKVRWKEGG